MPTRLLAPAGLVRPPSPATCRGARCRARRRSLSGLALGDHAAADHGDGGRALLRSSWRVVRPWRRWPRRRSTTCSSCGPGSAITPAPATCTPAPRRWSHATADAFPRREAGLRRCRASGPTRRPRSRRSRSTARPARSTAMSSGSIARLYAVEDEMPAAKPEIRALAGALRAAAARRRFRPGA